MDLIDKAHYCIKQTEKKLAESVEKITATKN